MLPFLLIEIKISLPVVVVIVVVVVAIAAADDDYKTKQKPFIHFKEDEDVGWNAFVVNLNLFLSSRSKNRLLLNSGNVSYVFPLQKVN